MMVTPVHVARQDRRLIGAATRGSREAHVDSQIWADRTSGRKIA
jgi:hypothetical protein